MTNLVLTGCNTLVYHVGEVIFMAKSYNGTPIVTLRLSDELRQQIDEITREEGKTMADVIREALQEYFKAKQNRPSSN